MKIKFFAIALAAAVSFSLYAANEAAPATAPKAEIKAQTGDSRGVPAATSAAAAAEEQKAAPEAAKPQEKSSWTSMLPIIIIIVVFYFFIFRGNKKQQQKRQEALDRTVKGTRVMLNSGVYGKVVEVKENEFLVEIAENVRVLVNKNGVSPVEEEKPAEAKDQDKK